MPSRELLAAVLRGDVTALKPLGHEPWAKVELAARSAEPLVLRPNAIVRVLAALREGTIATDEAQAWASFVRRGYLAGGLEPVHAIGIEYDRKNEDAIADVVARLDELGDDIDGEIDSAELRELEMRLQSS